MMTRFTSGLYSRPKLRRRKQIRDRDKIGVMKNRTGAFAIASIFGLAVMIIGAAAVHSPARAQSADLVLCDRLAADPADPDKPADVRGVAAIAPSDIANAIKFCKIAAAARIPPAVSRRALYQLGRAYAANQQLAEAMTAYRQAADKGSTSAMVELGMLLANGSGVAKDEAQARELFERAAAGGNPRGVINLAALSDNGGPQSDPAAARALLAKAAETGSAEAQFQLGLMDADGVGGPKDDVAARMLFEQAAAQNHAGALDWLGSFAEIGRGGPQDKAAAKSYYERAAALGNDDAKANLERLKCPYVVKDKHGQVVSHLCF
jgi:TPR repeat protein